jgi:hypothetical protein
MNILCVLPLIVICLIFLIYYTYKDIKFREINIMPIIFICFFSIVYLFLFVFKTNWILWKYYLLQLGINFLFIGIIYLMGKITVFAYIGEGDLYILSMIAFTSGYAVLFTEFVFLIALFVMALIPIFLFIYNLVKRNYRYIKTNIFKKIIILFLGTPKKINKITEFYSPLEILKIKNNKLTRKIVFTPNCESNIEIKNILKIAKSKKISKLWVSPLIPFILPILISYIITFFLFLFNLLEQYGPFAIFYI